MNLLASLDVELPLVAAPMAGGPSTPELVAASAHAGGIGFLAAGYRTVDQLAEQVAQTRQRTTRFGVNLFAPSPVSSPVDLVAYSHYRELLLPLAERFGVELPVSPREDEDWFAAKVDLLVAAPVPLLSFTFGIPSSQQIARLRRADVVLVATVTCADEARTATAAGIDGLVVQAPWAGGHWGTWDPRRRPGPRADLAALVREVRSVTHLPIWAAGGVWRSDQARAALAAGAEAVQVGTALLRTAEAGTSAAYRAGLAATATAPVGQTTSFSGRPAHGVRNAFVEQFTALAPIGYPALHYLTSPIRAAAAAAGDWNWINMWAGPGHAETTEEPVAQVLRRIAGVDGG